MAPPITFKAGGKQYVTVLTGMGTSISAWGPFLAKQWNYYTTQRRILTFVLDGTGTLPETPANDPVVAFDDPEYKAPAEHLLKSGEESYVAHCGACHGIGAVTGGHGPDLRASGIAAADEASFVDFLKAGYSEERGMPKFDTVPDDHLTAIHAYIRAQAAALRDSTSK